MTDQESKIYDWITSVTEILKQLDKQKSNVSKNIDYISGFPNVSNNPSIQELNSLLEKLGLSSIEEFKTENLNNIDSFNQTDIENAISALNNEISKIQSFIPSEIKIVADECPKDDTIIDDDYNNNDINEAQCEPEPPRDHFNNDLSPTNNIFSEFNNNIPDLTKLNPSKDEPVLNQLSADELKDIFNKLSDGYDNFDIESILNKDETGNSPINSNKEEEKSQIKEQNNLCFSIMNDFSLEIQKKSKRFSEIKETKQELQLKYYYKKIIYTFYDSCIKMQKISEDNLSELFFFIKLFNNPLTAIISKELLQYKVIELNSSLKIPFDPLLTLSDIENKFNDDIKAYTNQIESIFSEYFIQFDINYLKNIEGILKEAPNTFKINIDLIDKTNTNATSLIKQEEVLMNDSINKIYDNFLKTVIFLGNSLGSRIPYLHSNLNQVVIDNFLKISIEFNKISSEWESLLLEEQEIQNFLDNINVEIEKRLELAGCTIAKDPIPTNSEGSDINHKTISDNPNYTHYIWWKKFCKLATIVNLVPVHWPVGLLIPTPAGIIKIPLPIIWIPLVVLPTPVSISCFMIGQCGILPSPFLFLLHFLPFPLGPMMPNSYYFAVAMRPIATIDGQPPGIPLPLPSVPLPGILLFKIAINSLFSVISSFNLSFLNGILDSIKSQYTSLNNKIDLIDIPQVSMFNLKSVKLPKLSDEFTNIKNNIIEQSTIIKQEVINKLNSININNITTSKLENIIKPLNNFYDNTAASLDFKYQQIKTESSINSLINSINNSYNDFLNNVDSKISIKKSEIENLSNSLSKIPNLDINDISLGNIEDKIGNALSNLLQDIKNKIDTALSFLRTLIKLVNSTSLVNNIGFITTFLNSLGGNKVLDISPKINVLGFIKELDAEFTKLCPIISDNLPVWERLSLSNIPFLFFLWKWCKAGKKSGGFSEFPF